MAPAIPSTSVCSTKRTRPHMLVALNDHPVPRRLKTPTSYRQATEQPSDSLPATSCRNRTLGRLMRVAIIKPTRKQVV
ncbi:hypothetical protein EGN82_17880 [Salmonella enterica subsp. enterica serovar Potsdam]|uniref:Uncharacterized protein n=2 Tax=Enterobacter hormaechei TaxID=158836 RepID=A0AAE8CKQ1_9ENTR|nr:hypothetical protein CUN65_24275 [Enterobacter hormaechei subsp. xiangfangensis]AWX05079.1 hypothetical protein DPF84_25565 [Enterobacter hormaechei]EAA1242928.1 hypothetical protein [Salmonella enterica subsp. enterica serovar Mbandaka]EAO0319282.1 hypothetical protein [Salmonella enterica]EBS1839365.1 hypothetical protein [Salmonella enterica subsp. enterica serovar Potsdam]EBW2079842.1 hypothetical protein [Salmonella enterica subsp. enterica serovar Mikawasima]ECG5555798.1 hypothetical